jgi:hypothetical protein
MADNVPSFPGRQGRASVPAVVAPLLRRAAGEGLEDGVGTEGVVVVLVRVAGQDAVDPGAGQLREAVLRQVRAAGVIEGAGVGPGQADVLVERADGE